MKYLMILVMLLLPATAMAKPQPKPYREWQVQVAFSTAKVTGVFNTCVLTLTTMEAIMEARELAYNTINGPHTVHAVRIRNGCDKEDEDDDS